MKPRIEESRVANYIVYRECKMSQNDVETFVVTLDGEDLKRFDDTDAARFYAHRLDMEQKLEKLPIINGVRVSNGTTI